MIRKSINHWLNALFALEVVEDITQTKLEKAIGFDLSGSTIRPKVRQDKSIYFEFDFTLVFRCPASYAGIGFLTLSVNSIKKRTAGMTILGLENTERVEHINNTEMIISKQVHATLELEYNQVREQIKDINFEDDLPCQKSY